MFPTNGSNLNTIIMQAYPAKGERWKGKWAPNHCSPEYPAQEEIRLILGEMQATLAQEYRDQLDKDQGSIMWWELNPLEGLRVISLRYVDAVEKMCETWFDEAKPVYIATERMNSSDETTPGYFGDSLLDLVCNEYGSPASFVDSTPGVELWQRLPAMDVIEGVLGRVAVNRIWIYLRARGGADLRDGKGEMLPQNPWYEENNQVLFTMSRNALAGVHRKIIDTVNGDSSSVSAVGSAESGKSEGSTAVSYTHHTLPPTPYV